MSDTKDGKNISGKNEQEKSYDEMSLIDQWKYCRKNRTGAISPCDIQFGRLYLIIIIVSIMLFTLWNNFFKK